MDTREHTGLDEERGGIGPEREGDGPEREGDERPGDGGRRGVDEHSGIDPVRMAVLLEVLAEIDELPPDHPDAVAARRATARLFKSVKQRRHATPHR